jgi:hypothetical protein
VTRRLRPEAPISYTDCVDEGYDMHMDDGEIQDAENRYEAWLDRIGVA